jgi:hypothetical protein
MFKQTKREPVIRTAAQERRSRARALVADQHHGILTSEANREDRSPR